MADRQSPVDGIGRWRHGTRRWRDERQDHGAVGLRMNTTIRVMINHRMMRRQTKLSRNIACHDCFHMRKWQKCSLQAGNLELHRASERQNGLDVLSDDGHVRRMLHRQGLHP